jgi:hypothetical protein
VLGLLWDDIPRIIRPFSEVSEIRKNILLYKLKNEPKDSLIQSVRDTVYLRKEREKLNIKIKSAEEKWNQQELLCRQKGIHKIYSLLFIIFFSSLNKCVNNIYCKHFIIYYHIYSTFIREEESGKTSFRSKKRNTQNEK